MMNTLTGLLQVFCGLIAAGAVLAFAIRVSRRSHGSEPRAAGMAAVSPVRPEAAGGMAAPPATAHPRATAPFAGDGILTRGEAS